MTYFDARELPQPRPEYVAWVDVMGIQAHMSRSVSVAANFVFKLHVAALEAPRSAITLYPIMDGFYATSATRREMEAFLRRVFLQLADLSRLESTQHFRFVIRGALAYGEIYHGNAIRDEASRTLTNNPNYRASIFLGVPVVDAHESERCAPPFGVFVHESARSLAPTGEEPFKSDLWQWFDAALDLAQSRSALTSYYRWARENATSINYSSERIGVHEEMALGYFGGS